MDFRSSFAATVMVVAAATLVPGCDLGNNVGNLAGSLLDPGADLLDTPGRKLASGHYTGLQLDGALDSGGFVLAQRRDVEPPALAIVSFEGDGQCEVSPSLDFQRISSRIDVGLPGLVAVRQDDQGGQRGTVKFVGFDCTERLAPIEAAPLPSTTFPQSDPRGLLMLPESDELTLIDPHGPDLVAVTDGVTSARVVGDSIWAARNGSITVLDATLNEVASFGTNVRELLIIGLASDPSAAIVDDDGVKLVTIDPDAPNGAVTERVADEGCAPVTLGNKVIGFLSPCESRTLQLVVPGTFLGSTEERTVVQVASGVTAHDRAQSWWSSENSQLLYLHDDESDSRRGELRLMSFDALDEKSHEVLAENAYLDLGGAILTDWNGSSGDLMVPTYGSPGAEDESRITGLQKVAERVAQFPGGGVLSSPGVLANYDAETKTGDLLRLGYNGSEYNSLVMATGVPVQKYVSEEDMIVFVGDHDGEAGTLYLMRGGSLPSAIADDVLAGTARFLEQPSAVAYLTRHEDAGVAGLHAWLLDAELDLQIAPEVSEYRELPWPSAGLLYAVPRGDAAGIWFAAAR